MSASEAENAARRASAVATAGALAERGVTELVVTSRQGVARVLRGRQTDLPGELLAMDAGSVVTGRGRSGEGVRVRVTAAGFVVEAVTPENVAGAESEPIIMTTMSGLKSSAGTNGHSPARAGDGASKVTIAHVTHEAIEQVGGIGTVLQGLMTSPVYRAKVGRNLLIGPLPYADSAVKDPMERLGPDAIACEYSGVDGHDPHGLGALLKPIEWAFGVRMVYGRRAFQLPGAIHDRAHDTEAEVLLVDVTNPNRERLAACKWLLWEKFGVDSQRYEHSWDYEEYMRLAEPAYFALCALVKGGTPTVVIAHEFMGLATALRCSLDRARFRTVFHAHECSTARRICEALPGHDAAFYPAMRVAMREGRYVNDVFGDQSDFARHSLVSKTYHLDATLAVGPETAAELLFLSEPMSTSAVHVAYNGLPAPVVTWDEKKASRDLVNTWLKNVLGYVPDYLFTHVTRPVPSKGLWRDQKIGAHLEKLLEGTGKTGAYVLLTCGAPTRTTAQVNAMAHSHQWPKNHVEGFPDLSGPEVRIYRAMKGFEAHAHHGAAADASGGIAAILVNQFGFTRERLGDAAPAGITIDDLRRAADVELGMSVYEPFGIAMLEPLHAGAVCVVSSVCGCCGLVHRAMTELGLTDATCPLVLTADFTAEVTVPTKSNDHTALRSIVHMSASERDGIEDRLCAKLAGELLRRLPKSDDDRRRYLAMGQTLAARMSWDRVVETDFLPVVMGAVAR